MKDFDAHDVLNIYTVVNCMIATLQAEWPCIPRKSWSMVLHLRTDASLSRIL